MYEQMLGQTLKSLHDKWTGVHMYVLSSNVQSSVVTRVVGILDMQALPCEIREVQRHAEITCTNLRVVLEILASSIFLNHPVKRSL